jgi:hypothetical protein
MPHPSAPPRCALAVDRGQKRQDELTRRIQGKPAKAAKKAKDKKVVEIKSKRPQRRAQASEIANVP